MRHVGVFLAARPEGGGVYQYCLAVVRGLRPLAQAGWRISAFLRFPEWQRELPAELRTVVTEVPWLARAASQAYKRLDPSREGLRRVGRMLPTVRALDASDCDLIVFPGQDEASYQTRRPALVAVHDLMHRYEPQFREYGGGESQRRDKHYRNISERAAGILVDSELGKRQLVESYPVDPARVHVLPFAPPRYLAASADVDVRAKYGVFDRYLFYPAQFWEHKNHVRLIEAVALVRSRGQDVKLVLCGARKEHYERVVSRIEALHLARDVLILGYVPDADMCSLYKQAVATVFVSLIGPTNIPPLEAISVGSPLIVSNVYAMPEQVGDAAMLVDPRSMKDIADKIERVWTDEALRARLAERGRSRSALWTEDDFGARLREIITRMTGGTGPGGGGGGGS